MTHLNYPFFFREDTLLKDAQQLHRLSKKKSQGVDASLKSAQDLFNKRLHSHWTINYPESLPISSYKDKIIEAWQNHQILLIRSDTGTGKSTQLPKIALEAGFSRYGWIGVTQPRRIATQAIATRLSQELVVRPGEVVGWQIRHKAHVKPHHHIKLMTDGVLVQEIGHDYLLTRYGALIIDEAHERSINIDLILGYLKKLLPQRPDLKIAIVSATLEIDKFKAFFENSVCIDIPGTAFPVVSHYLNEEQAEFDKKQKVLYAVKRALEFQGDLLYFLPIEGEIHGIAKLITSYFPQLEVIKLFARASLSSQQKAFKPQASRRVILSTNIAETSLTLPRIGVVIDSGEHKIACFDPGRKMMTYPIVPITKHNIIQRKGRAGRLHPGVCFHLYTQEDAQNRPDALLPAMLRSSLSWVLLKIVALKKFKFDEFPFIDTPKESSLQEAWQFLLMTQLVTEDKTITKLGFELSQLPVDPRYGLMIYQGRTLSCLEEILVIIAFLSGQDPRIKPFDTHQKAHKKHFMFEDKRSDFMTILILWLRLQTKKDSLSRREWEEYCASHYLCSNHIRTWEDNLAQLEEICQVARLELTETRIESNFFQIHRALLFGLIDKIFLLDKNNFYRGPRNVQALIHPSSLVQREKPEFLLAVSLERMQETYLRWVGPFESGYLLQCYSHLIKWTRSDPYYDSALGLVFYQEIGTLWGLALVTRPKMLLELKDPLLAREIFIKNWFSEHDVYELRELAPSWVEASKEATKVSKFLRQPSLLKRADELADLALKLWPMEITNRAKLTQYARLIPKVTLDAFLSYKPQVSIDDLPDMKIIDGEEVEIYYECDRTSDYDGISYLMSEELWNQHHPHFWLFLCKPMQYKILEAIFSTFLTKEQRQKLIPLHDSIDFFIAEGPPGGNLFLWISNLLASYYDIIVPANRFSIKSLPAEYIPFIMIEKNGELIELGKITDNMETSSLELENQSSDWIEQVYESYRRGLMRAPRSENELATFYDRETWIYYLTLGLEKEATKSFSANQLKSVQGLLFRHRGIAISPSFLMSLAFKIVYLKNQMLFKNKKEYEVFLKKEFTEQQVVYKLQVEKLCSIFSFAEHKAYRGSSRLWQQAQRVFNSQIFMMQLDAQWVERVSLWNELLSEMGQKEVEKPILVRKFEEEWNELLVFTKERWGHTQWSDHTKNWQYIFEWGLSVFKQPLKPLVPISLKRIKDLLKNEF